MTMAAPNVSSVGGLPAELNTFVGRRHEIAEVKRLLSEARLVTLVGVGGVGKSRLSLRVGFDLRRTFHDGVWLVELAALESPELLVQTVTETLEIHDRSLRPPIDVLVDHLRDKQILVILDNCEHLLEDCAVMADTLIRSAPGLRILATSRQALGVGGERMMALPPLSVPDTDGVRPSAESLRHSDAVRLFAERAQAILPGFEITEANRESVARICRRLDGIPLAIELAAVRLRALSVEQLLARLDDRFRLLTSGVRTAMPRQQTLRALIDWSYALCTEQEKLLWSRLSVFSGGLDLEAAEQVCSGNGIAPEEIFDLVNGLVEKSVLAREEHPSMMRYRLLETIRQYGRERLRESGEEAELKARHRDWYRDLTTRAQHGWYGPDQVTWFTRLRAEHGNLRTALDYCLSTPGEAEAGLAIATALRFYWIAAGALREGRGWLDRLLTTGVEPTLARARALCVNARLAVLQSDFEVAEAMLDGCVDLGRGLDDASVLAGAAYVSGLTALIKRDPAGAVDLLSQAVDGNRAAGDEMGVVNSMMYLATAHTLLGRSDQAVALFKECLAICEARHEHWFRSYTLWVFGIEMWKQGDTARGVEMEREAIRLKQPFDDRLGIALCVEALAWMAADDQAERAAVLLGASQQNWQSFGGPMFGYLAGFHDTAETMARESLGGSAFDAAFHKGTELNCAEAVAYAMGESAPAGRKTREPSPLTPREMEIARLVSKGMSNKAIAASLVIAQRTAEAHVEHILCKLGFNSRAQIAAWVGEQAPSPPGSSS
ncbi:helix-turn-helix transcriptional regulator [Nonomuraea basaltis]|uniref:helix-turn-helix transcriptional regulator n=1 Tax=Nonomuraea basaltis TaxID=2495887 RepID=UPI00110C44EA|nr:LuxR C-terminal-related transcriptional regulator [Nonomuraea basaltis]TMR94651.1 LuxR family transcriptional regulator [Nonomuraea basaltis]